MKDKAFELVFEDHNRMVTAYLYAVVRDHEQALDLTQETFITAYRRMHTFESGRSVGAWLRGIARNLARNYLRKRKSACEFLLDGTEMDSMFASFDSYASEEIREERVKILDKCIARLPERQKEVIGLRYTANEKVGTIARHLGIVEKTVSQLLWHARLNLKRCIASLAGTAGEVSQ